MRKVVAVGIISILISAYLFGFMISENEVNELNEVPALGSVFNVNTETFYSSIQQCIDDANPGDTIEISAGNYVENVVVHKSLTLISTDAVIDANAIGTAMKITADNVEVNGISFMNTGDGHDSPYYE